MNHKTLFLTTALCGAFSLLPSCAHTPTARSQAPIRAGESASLESPSDSLAVEASSVRGARTIVASQDGQAADKAKKPKPAKAKKPTLGELKKQLEASSEAMTKALRELRYADAELEIAELGARAGRAEVTESLRAARVGLEAALEEQARFDEVGRPIALQEAKLALDDAQDRRIKAETDLVGMEEIFEGEVDASAKDEILRRSRRARDRAGEAFALAQAKHAQTADRELPAKMKNLSSEVRAAEAALLAAEANAAKRTRSIDLDVEKATDNADDKKRANRKAKAKVESLKARVDEMRTKNTKKTSDGDKK